MKIKRSELRELVYSAYVRGYTDAQVRIEDGIRLLIDETDAHVEDIEEAVDEILEEV